MKKLLIFLTLMVACSAVVGAQANRLAGRQWKPLNVNGVAVPENSRAFLQIDQNQSRFTGHTGCNSMFGSVNVQANRIDFGNVGMTRMACVEQRVRRVEAALVESLRITNRYRVRGNTLELYTRNRVIATFTGAPAQDPDEPERVSLETMKWTLDEIEGRPVAKIGQSAFVVFDRNKASAGGNSSCNVFGGSYSTSGTNLRITDVMSTMRACVEDERMSIERDFLNGLRNANRYEIVGARLRLYRDQRLLLGFSGVRK